MSVNCVNLKSSVLKVLRFCVPAGLGRDWRTSPHFLTFCGVVKTSADLFDMGLSENYGKNPSLV